MEAKSWYIGLIIAIIIISIIVFILVSFTDHEAIVTIDDLVVKRYSGKDKYLVYTEDHGVFQNTDNWLRGKFRSSDLQAKLDVEKTYKIRYCGVRIPLFSMYHNILEATPVD